MTVVGLISDTHGLLRVEARRALAGSDAIIHAGDVGKPEVLEGLQELAPLTVIRGNVDKWAMNLPDVETVDIDEFRFYVIHDRKALAVDPVAEGIDVVISGHSHKPDISRRAGVLYVNPGSAGPRRFSLPVSLAKVTLADGKAKARLITLKVNR